ncbi:outer membrane protein assembly factor BamE [Roseomonas sp. CCTCC AB2023176]|uniref:outer membrane protein assembly factor BamE n=1 Tax=Roseomonas sp. CCTCC AB2023176 TaxID=3342640 RepID=UPI0035DA6E57
MVPPRQTVNSPRAAALRAALLALPLALTACGGRTALDRLFGPVPEMRGNRVDPEVLREITPGVQTRADVQALLGSPSATSTFENDRWYYISAVSRTRIGRVPGVSDQRVVEIVFNPAGVVQGVRELGPQDGRDVQVVERTTPVPGNDRTFLQALFGNIGRLGPSGAGGATGPGVGPTSGN